VVPEGDGGVGTVWVAVEPLLGLGTVAVKLPVVVVD
jgi:hypothetical protein